MYISIYVKVDFALLTVAVIPPVACQKGPQ